MATTPAKQVVPISGSITFDVVQGPAGKDGTPGRDGKDGAPGPQGPKGDPGRDGVSVPGQAQGGTGWTDVTTLGCTPGGPNAAILQADYARRNGPVTYYFPPGTWSIERTLRLGGDGVTVKGAGTFLTTLAGGGGYPLLMFGVTEKAADGFAIGPDARPDAAGVLDSTAQGGPGWRAGFATQGRSSLYLPTHSLALGPLNAAGGWTYHGGVTAVTERFLIGPPAGGRIPECGSLWGVGGEIEGGTPGPLLGGFAADTAPGVGTVQVSIRFEGDPVGKYRRGTYTYNDPTKPHRFAHGINTETGDSFGWVDGTPNFIKWDGKGGDFKGLTLEKNTADWPWQFGLPSNLSYAGTGKPTPDVILWGYHRLAAYAPADPGTDKGRYFTSQPQTLGLFRADVTESGRTLYMEGVKGAGRAVILDTMAKPTSIQTGAAVEDLTLERGSPGIAAGVIYDHRVERVRSRGGDCGYGSLRVGGGSYLTTFAACEFSGRESGVSLFGTIVGAREITVRQGGATSVRLTSCSSTVNGLMLAGFDPTPENGVRVYGAPGWGNTHHFTSIFGDNEDQKAFTRGFIEMDQAPSWTPSALTVVNAAANTIAPDASFFRLTGYGTDGTFRGIAVIDARGIFVPDNCAGVLRTDGPDGAWVGTVSTASAARGANGGGSVKVVAP